MFVKKFEIFQSSPASSNQAAENIIKIYNLVDFERILAKNGL